jgi:3-dehydroquinate synthase
MEYLQQSFSVKFEYKVYFTTDVFNKSSKALRQFLKDRSVPSAIQKILFVVDSGVLEMHPYLDSAISTYFSNLDFIFVPEQIIVVPGGEESKNHDSHLELVLDAINRHGIDRHSYVAAIGGGSVLDLAGYAAAIAHRGIRLIRFPTTVLAQNDSGVGVKNGINYFNKKNFLGTFAPPVAVFNDAQFLSTLPDRHWRSGISEAIKVALIKDGGFFDYLEEHAEALLARKTDNPSMKYLIQRCAELHIQHIGSGDPFETGSSRPLDFGHWSAHKLEQLTNFDVLHGEAVAMGMALDTMYSALSGRLTMAKATRVINLLKQLGFDVTHPLMQISESNSPLLLGLQEFREHLGGRLTIMLLSDIGKGQEVHEIDFSLMQEAARRLSSN